MIVQGYKLEINYRQKGDSLLHKNIQIDDGTFKNKWKTPSFITNSILSESVTLVNRKLFFDALGLLNCKHIVWLIKENKTLENIQKFTEDLVHTDVNSVQIYIKYEKIYFSDSFGELVIPNKIIKKVIVYDAPFNKNYENKIIFIEDSVSHDTSRNNSDFIINFRLFHESQNHHTYFNRKLYIGPNGEIKNAPECEDSFGFIQDLKSPEELKKIIQTPEFQKYWFVHKEISDVCKDCEFRHMCVDNRLPYKRKENEWYHKIECNYNPYIAK